jgi:FAD/FMN-containing dehydrogenase
MTTQHQRPAIATMHAGLALTVMATIVPHVDHATANVLADHPAFTDARIDTAVTTYLAYLSVVGALGVVGWLGTIWAVKAGKRWVRGGATAMLALATSIALFDLLVKDTSGDRPAAVAGLGRNAAVPGGTPGGRLAVEEVMTELTHLRALDITGQILTPDGHAYDEARAVFATHVDARPALIARVSGPGDIARLIAHARETGSELAVRGGGHSPAGYGVCDGGIVIDVSALRSFELDPARRTAWAGAGLTAGEFTVAAGKHGLATGFGDTGSVGIGGITLAGGIGYLVRKHGLTIDNVLAAEIVTADGRLRHADAETEPELFWALRGGGGNFGVVTRLKYRLQPVDSIVGGLLVLPATPAVVTGFVAEAEAARDELSTIANVMPAPPLPFVPEQLHGSLVVMASMVYAGDVKAGQRAVAPFRALAKPVADLLRPMKYPEMFPDQPGNRLGRVTRTMFAGSIGRRQAETILERTGESSALMAACEMRALGGAMRVPVHATAFTHRHSRVMINVQAMYDPSNSERSEHTAWARGLAAELYDGDSGAYAGFLADEGEERVRAAYPGATWERLAAVKAIFDPDNVFRLNQNIPPGA